jgi:MinD superfamily P-loop ATPase
VREIVVVSGKGGTGKTTVTASLAVLAGRPVVADCDVDAADLHLLLAPEVRERHEFRGGRVAVVRPDLCAGCGACAGLCRFGAIGRDGEGDGGFRVDPSACEGCGVCVRFCPEGAIDFPERTCGEWMVSGTRCGPMVHARLRAGAENSGKLVARVREEARRIALEEGRSPILVDGPPGIGCPVIASVTGAALVLAVTEPTVAGAHDLGRVLALTGHFGIPTAVCVNRWDVNPAMTERIEAGARRAGARVEGRIRHDPSVTGAQLRARAVVETDAPSASDLRRLWERLA